LLNARQIMWGVEPAVRKRRRKTAASASVDGGGSTTKKRARRPMRQLSLAQARTWGGPRKGSGRKPADPTARRNVVHRTRPAHDDELPVHITMRRAKGLPSFRSERLRRLVERAILDTRRDGFRIAHYSVQADHLHLIVEADDPTTLTSGMRSFAVRIAMRVNGRVLGRRRGRVWGDRYHRRDLTTPTEVRNALVYLLANHIKHGQADVGLLDPCSSGPWFTGWRHTLDPPPERCPVQCAQTWVLRKGWHLHGGGLITLGEVPLAART
jgi:REP element-mobilizing transposase RayT